MSEETTTEQLAEIEGQAEDTPATQYTPPEGWRVLAVGEALREGDVTVRADGYQYPTERVGGWVGANQRYIRPIEPEPQPEPVQVREGRWRTRNGSAKDVTAMPTDHEDFAAAYPWWDGVSTWRDDGRWLAGGSTMDLVEYLGPIEQQPEPQPVQGGLVRDVTHLLEESGVLDSAKAEQQIEELRSEVSYVQNLLGTERRRVVELEELVGSLRTINVTQEKAFNAAGKENTALRNQLEAAKAEMVQERLERNRWHNQVLRVTAELDDKTTQCEILQIELDAAQQVPADSPELRQLWADLAEVAHDRDTYKHAHELLVQDIDATQQRTKAMTVEAICEWIEPIRREDPHLRAVILFHLPKIMRSLAGLNSPEDVD